MNELRKLHLQVRRLKAELEEESAKYEIRIIDVLLQHNMTYDDSIICLRCGAVTTRQADHSCG